MSHAVGDDAHSRDAGSFCRVDHADDVAVAEAAVGHDEQRLVGAVFEERAQMAAKLSMSDLLSVD